MDQVLYLIDIMKQIKHILEDQINNVNKLINYVKRLLDTTLTLYIYGLYRKKCQLENMNILKPMI